MIYLDNNATTQPLPEVCDAVGLCLREHWHNPSSVHRPGQSARQQVELARRSVASLIGCTPRELVFTSGATESIDAAIQGTLLASPTRNVIITSPIEHEAVRDLCSSLGSESGERVVTRHLPLLPGGVVDADRLDELIDDSVALVSVQWANNETGAIQPVERLGTICRSRGVAFHSDATQWIGKLPCDLSSVPIDLASFSGHKFHAIKGTGCLYIRRGMRLRPIILGTQELDRRGGTENVPGIVAMGVAAEATVAWLAQEEHRRALSSLRDLFERTILDRLPGTSVNGPVAPGLRLWNTSNIAFPRLEAEALLLLLSERGVCASAGAACSSGSLDPSPVLLAMGVPPERAHGSLRFSLSRHTTPEEIGVAARIVCEAVERLRVSTASAIES